MYVALGLAPISLRIVFHLAVPPLAKGAEQASSSSVGIWSAVPGAYACGLPELEVGVSACSMLLAPGGVNVRCRLYCVLSLPVLLRLAPRTAAADAGAAHPICSWAGRGGGAASCCDGQATAPAMS